MKSISRCVAVLVLPALAWAGLTQAGDKDGGQVVPKAFLPADAYKELKGRSIKTIASLLAGNPDEDKQKRAQVEALILGGYTLCVDDAKADDKAALRQAALNVIVFARKKDTLPQAQKLAAELGTIAAAPQPKAGPFEFKPVFDDLPELMNLYRVQAKGGEGLHADLQVNIRLKGALNGTEEFVRYLAQKPLSETAFAKAAGELPLFAYRQAVMGEIIHDFAPPKKGKMDPKEWRELSLTARDASIELAQAAKKKDTEAVFKAASRLNTSCNQCHSVFRN